MLRGDKTMQNLTIEDKPVVACIMAEEFTHSRITNVLSDYYSSQSADAAVKDVLVVNGVPAKVNAMIAVTSFQLLEGIQNGCITKYYDIAFALQAVDHAKYTPATIPVWVLLDGETPVLWGPIR